MAFLSYRRGALAWALAVLTGCGAGPMKPMAMAPDDTAPPAPMSDRAADAQIQGGAPVDAPASASEANGPATATAAPSRRPSPPGSVPPAPGPPLKKGLPPTAPRGAKEVAAAKDVAAPGVEQMLIFTGRLDLEIDPVAFGETLDDAVDLAVKHGGYIGQQTDTSVTLRVPSSEFRIVMRELEKLGDVRHRSVNAQDVSKQYFDLGVRLKSLLATRERLQKFLDRAKTIDEVLRIERELMRLNTEIDTLQGQRRYLAAQSAYSTITLSLSARPKPVKKVVKREKKERPPPPPPPPPPPKTLTMPIPWLSEVSLDDLLTLGRK
ncbi:MAG: DUF4349 domain-containing protein [Myxococcota bacterium]